MKMNAYDCGKNKVSYFFLDTSNITYEKDIDIYQFGKLPKKVFVQNVSTYNNDSLCYLHILGEDRETGLAMVRRTQELLIVKEKVSDKLFQALVMSALHRTYLIGCDPEIFVTQPDGKLIPAFNFLNKKPGPKLDRRYLGPSERPVYWDGFQAEFETQATGCLQEQCKNVSHGLINLLNLARKKYPEATLSLKTVMDIHPILLKETKEEHAQFGCMPSFNVYGKDNPIKDGYDVLFRPAGGHMHFGIGKQEPAVIERIVKALDMVLAVCCTSLFAGYEDPRRRELYGLPGEFRLPPHGLEYRTISNAWLAHPAIMQLCFDLARKVVSLGLRGWVENLNWTCDEKETIRILMEYDIEAARKVMQDNKNSLLLLFKSVYRDDATAQAAFDVFHKGMGSTLKDPTDIIGNWSLLEGGRSLYYQFKGLVADEAIAGKKVA